MHHYARDVAENLEDEAADHAAEETPDTVADAGADLDDKTKTKDCGIECIAGNGRPVGEVSHGNGTCLQSTEVWGGDEGRRDPGGDGGGGGRHGVIVVEMLERWGELGDWGNGIASRLKAGQDKQRRCQDGTKGKKWS